MENTNKNIGEKSSLILTDEKIIPNTAKQTENIAKRTHVVDNQETRDLLLNDTYHVIETTLDKDGSTGKLSNPDGIVRGKPMAYRGFFIQCYALTEYDGELDVFGHLVWYGWAKMQKTILDRTDTIEFAATKHATEHSAGNWLIKLVDAYHGNNVRVN